MIAWTWFPSIAGLALLLLCGAYRMYNWNSSRRHRDDGDGNGKLYAGVRSAAASVRTDPMPARNMAPSSTYKGEVCFFDSIEHRDMFEANHHRPVTLDLVQAHVQMAEQHGCRLERSACRDTRSDDVHPSDTGR